MSGTESENPRLPSKPRQLDQQLFIDHAFHRYLPAGASSDFTFTTDKPVGLGLLIHDAGTWRPHYDVRLSPGDASNAEVVIDGSVKPGDDLPGLLLRSGTAVYTGNGRPPIRTIRITAGRPMKSGGLFTIARSVDVDRRIETVSLLVAPTSPITFRFELIGSAGAFVLGAGQTATLHRDTGTIDPPHVAAAEIRDA